MKAPLGQVVRSEEEIFDELANLCVSIGYVHAIAYFCYRDNLIRFKDKLTSDIVIRLYDHSRLLRTEISTLIGLMVREPIDYTLPDPRTINEYIERTEKLLLEIHHAMSGSWLRGSGLSQGSSLIENPFSKAENLREPIFYGGESAFGFQYLDFTLLRYGDDDDWLQSNKGFVIADAVAVSRALETLLTDQQMATLKAMRNKPMEEWTILPAFEFTAQQLSDITGISLQRVQSVLLAFSLSNDNKNPRFSSISDFNETNARPILRIGSDKYLLLQYQSFAESLYESPFFWMGIYDKTYAPTATKHRGAFTERFVADRLRSVFGSARVFTNVTIYGKNKTKFGEVDVLVLFGDRAILVQAKSKRLTIEARKGNDLQLKSDFKNAVQDAYDQAYRCATTFFDPSFTLKDGEGQTISSPVTLRAVLPLCIVSDHYPALAFQARQFLKTKVSGNILSPLVTDVFTVDIMAEMLATPLHFLHYLHLRSRFGDRFVASHELNLLGYHLSRNLWCEGENNMMSIADEFAADLDIAMLTRRRGAPGRATPDGILTRFVGTTFGQLVSQIDTSGDPELTDLGIWLLSLNERTARSIGAGIDRIVTMTRQDKSRHDITIGTEDPPSGLTVHCSYDPEPEAMSNLVAHANLRKHSIKADAWYALNVSPADGSILMGAVAKYPWEPDPMLDRILKMMPKPLSVKAFHRQMAKDIKIGRNHQCPCGSGKKYKLCCMNR